MNRPIYELTHKLKVESIEQGLILPRREDLGGEEIRWGYGGVLDHEDSYVQLSFYDGGWARHGGYYPYDPAQVDYMDEEVIYFGHFFSHWGHFLIDGITRAWYVYQLAQKRDDFKVAYIGEEEPHGNNLRFLELLGITEEQLVHVTKPTRFRNILVPEQGFKSCEWYSEEHKDMLDGVIQSALSSDHDWKKLKRLKKVYFTRRSFAKAIYSEFGEAYLESVFLKNAYKAVAPESLSLDEQIYLWNHAESICCVNGSIPLNVMFSGNEKLDLIILNKTSILHENPYVLLNMRNITPVFLDVYSEPFKGYPRSLGEGPYLFAATKEFDAFCKDRAYDQTMDDRRRRAYFCKERIKCFFCILGIRRKIRLGLSKMLPASLKGRVRKLLELIRHQ